MQYHIRRDDGRYLCGGGSMATAPAADVPYANLRAAMAAIDRYRLVAAVYAPARKSDGFTLFGVK